MGILCETVCRKCPFCLRDVNAWYAVTNLHNAGKIKMKFLHRPGLKHNGKYVAVSIYLSALRWWHSKNSSTNRALAFSSSTRDCVTGESAFRASDLHSWLATRAEAIGSGHFLQKNFTRDCLLKNTAQMNNSRYGSSLFSVQKTRNSYYAGRLSVDPSLDVSFFYLCIVNTASV